MAILMSLQRAYARALFHLHVGPTGPARTRLVYAIRRRTIYIAPPTYHDLLWIFDQFHHREISEMFGYQALGPIVMPRMFRSGSLVISVVHRSEDGKRIGFVIMYPPAGFSFWEFGYAIPDPADRNAFDALNATDAMAHYMFEHLQVPELGWRTREDNQNADAVVRRLGYEQKGEFEQGGHRYRLYRLDQAGWARRKAKIARGEGLPFEVIPPPFHRQPPG